MSGKGVNMKAPIERALERLERIDAQVATGAISQEDKEVQRLIILTDLKAEVLENQ